MPPRSSSVPWVWLALVQVRRYIIQFFISLSVSSQPLGNSTAWLSAIPKGHQKRKSHTYLLFRDTSFSLNITTRQTRLICPSGWAGEQSVKREIRGRCERLPTAEAYQISAQGDTSITGGIGTDKTFKTVKSLLKYLSGLSSCPAASRHC